MLKLSSDAVALAGAACCQQSVDADQRALSDSRGDSQTCCNVVRASTRPINNCPFWVNCLFGVKTVHTQMPEHLNHSHCGPGLLSESSFTGLACRPFLSQLVSYDWLADGQAASNDCSTRLGGYGHSSSDIGGHCSTRQAYILCTCVEWWQSLHGMHLLT